jgi:hypothetical protein
MYLHASDAGSCADSRRRPACLSRPTPKSPDDYGRPQDPDRRGPRLSRAFAVTARRPATVLFARVTTNAARSLPRRSADLRPLRGRRVSRARGRLRTVTVNRAVTHRLGGPPAGDSAPGRRPRRTPTISSDFQRARMDSNHHGESLPKRPSTSYRTCRYIPGRQDRPKLQALTPARCGLQPAHRGGVLA